mgnify:CR=1 FL=1
MFKSWQNYNISCLFNSCRFTTQPCESKSTAIDLLKMHVAANPAQDARDQQSQMSHKWWILEVLELEPSDRNGEVYLFWKDRFDAYLQEYGVVDSDARYLKLKSRISYA